MADVKNCRLLKLPAELRNRIYELALNSNSKYKLELISAQPPHIALLLTCRRVYNEASGIYLEACHRFWSCNRFYLWTETGGITRTMSMSVAALHRWLRRTGDDVLELITSLDIKVTDTSGIGETNTDHYQLLKPGLWECKCATFSPIKYVAYMRERNHRGGEAVVKVIVPMEAAAAIRQKVDIGEVVSMRRQIRELAIMGRPNMTYWVT